MKELMEKFGGTPYPEMIKGLPEADIPFEGVRGWILPGEKMQAVFFDLEPIGKVPPHSHSTQWGIVIDGKMNLTIDGKTKLYQKGDWYYIPEGVTHSAEFLTRVFVIDVFDEPERWKAK